MLESRMLVVLVHGWSVHHTDTYGGLPKRLPVEAAAGRIPPVDVRDVRLGKYISFRDEVRVDDLSRAFEAALRDTLGKELDAGRRFACITHSTGGPVVRDWWQRQYLAKGRACPMSHLVMLAPASFGSALAQLGKGRLGRMKSWFDGVEPGEGVLDWLELGSPEAWALNRSWITDGFGASAATAPVYPFVLTGQTIDRKLYDHVNSYTGELGSDGVVRVAAANLNATYVELEQRVPAGSTTPSPSLALATTATRQDVAFSLIPGRSHSGEERGILASIPSDDRRHPTVDAIVRCLNVRSMDDYARVRTVFASDTARVVDRERVERFRRAIFEDSLYVHDPASMILVRLRDDRGHAITDFDLKLTGRKNDPSRLPPGFFIDRQGNRRSRNTLTYFVNHALMEGSPEIREPKKNEVVRAATPGVGQLGMTIQAQPAEGYVRYVAAAIDAHAKNLEVLLRPHQTTMIDVTLRRVVHAGAFVLTNDLTPKDFRDQPKGPPIR